MLAPILRLMEDPNATPKERIKVARKLAKDGRLREALSLLEALTAQSKRHQLNAMVNLLRKRQIKRGLRAILCMLRSERYRTEASNLLVALRRAVGGADLQGTSNGEAVSHLGIDTQLASAAMPGRDWNAVSPALHLAYDRDATLKEKLKAAKLMVNEGRVEEAISLLRAAAEAGRGSQLRAMVNLAQRAQFIRSFRASACLVRTGKYRADVLKLLDVSTSLTGYENQPESVKTDGADYRIKDAGSTVTVIAFTGLDRRFTVAVYFLERLLSRFGVNLIILYDRQEAYYLAGIPGLGSNVGETCIALKHLCEKMGTRQIICLGQSSGGYGALRYGIELGAHHVLAFSPAYVGVLKPDKRLEIEARTGHRLDDDIVDLRMLYARRETVPGATIVYGAENRYDERSADALATMRHVTVRPLPGISRHGTLSEAVSQGLFFDLMSTALGNVATA